MKYELQKKLIETYPNLFGFKKNKRYGTYYLFWNKVL